MFAKGKDIISPVSTATRKLLFIAILVAVREWKNVGIVMEKVI